MASSVFGLIRRYREAVALFTVSFVVLTATAMREAGGPDQAGLTPPVTRPSTVVTQPPTPISTPEPVPEPPPEPILEPAAPTEPPPEPISEPPPTIEPTPEPPPAVEPPTPTPRNKARGLKEFCLVMTKHQLLKKPDADRICTK